jgi:hypothetical protein
MLAANGDEGTNTKSAGIAAILVDRCQRRLNIEPPCRSKFEPGRVADF